MQPTLVSLIGLLSAVDAAILRPQFQTNAAAASSTSAATTEGSTLTEPSAVVAAVAARPAFTTSAAARVVLATTAKSSSTSPKATTTSKPTTSSTAKPTTTSKTTTSSSSSKATTTSKPTTSTTSKATTTNKPTTTSLHTSTTSKKTSTSASPTATGTTSTKRGLCWPWNNAAATFNLFNPAVETWVYNWEMWSPLSGTSFSSAQYVGMVRDKSRLEQISWYYTATSRVSPYLLGFNEPDLPGDTYLSVADAVTYWKEYFLPLRKSYGTILGSPVVTNGVGTNWGIDWFNQFNAACQDTQTTSGVTKSCFDFIPIHWYGSSLADFQSWVNAFHTAYPSYPLWITEFAFENSDATTVQTLSKAAIQWLDAQSFVARYSQYAPMTASSMGTLSLAAMVSDDLSSLTTVGKIYNGNL